MRGRPRATRTNTRVAERRRKVAHDYLTGLSQSEIAHKFSLSQATISKDLKAIRAEWLASAVRDFDAARAQELAKIDALELEYWQAWHASKAEKTKKHKTENRNARGRAQATRLSQEITERDGDPRYLQGVQWCVERRIKLLGLDAPVTTVSHVGGIKDKPVEVRADISHDLDRSAIDTIFDVLTESGAFAAVSTDA